MFVCVCFICQHEAQIEMPVSFVLVHVVAAGVCWFVDAKTRHDDVQTPVRLVLPLLVFVVLFGAKTRHRFECPWSSSGKR